jgi:hypothetical protein
VGYFKRKPDRDRLRRLVRALNDDAVTSRPWAAIPDRPPRAQGFVRFSTRDRHPSSQRRRGIFSATYRALGEGDVEPDVASRLETALGWFETNLAVPKLDEDRAVFLFKSNASECMRQIRQLIHGLRDAGVWIEMQTFKNPGAVVYEDAHQIAVIPWADAKSI